MAKILEKRPLTPITKLYKVDAPLVAKSAKPGQFVIVRVRDGGERIPLTIADYDRDDGTLTIVVQEVGTTTRFLGQLEIGDEILDLVGPLGMPLEIPVEGHIVGIGGGFGAAAAVACFARALFEGALDGAGAATAVATTFLSAAVPLLSASRTSEEKREEGSASRVEGGANSATSPARACVFVMVEWAF